MLPRGQFSATKAKPIQSVPQVPGPAGLDGTPGTTVVTGTGAPTSSSGVVGSMYLDTATGNWYGPKNSTTEWTGVGPYP